MRSHYKTAHKLIGTKEVSGLASNPTILDMFSTMGHDWVKDDSKTAWCAAFVGTCLRKNGYKTPPRKRALSARAYAHIGTPLDDYGLARRGDIVVLSRTKNPQLGHVGFFHSWDAKTGKVKILGGNQSNQVNVTSYRQGRIVTINRLTRADLKQPPTIQAVREAGSQTIASVDKIKNISAGAGVSGAIATAKVIADQANSIKSVSNDLNGTFQWAISYWPCLLIVGFTYLVYRQCKRIEARRLADEPEIGRLA